MQLASVRMRPRPPDHQARSRIGGAPWLPADVEWPTWREHPLGFLAQVDLGEVPRLDPHPYELPQAGMLCFFYPVEADGQPWGFDPGDAGSARVLHIAPGQGLEPREVPPEIVLRYDPAPLALEVELTLPDPDSPAGPDLRGDDELRAEYLDLVGAVFEAHGGEREPQHRLLGHPDQVQDEMQTECQLVTQGLEVATAAGWDDPRAAPLARGAAGWRLLAQFDSGYGRGELMWGDAGRLYFWILEGDLLNRRFDRVWAILQSG